MAKVPAYQSIKNSVKLKEPIKILCESYTIRESLNEETGEVESVFLEGVAITFGKPTRNRVSYTYQSGVEKHKTLIGKPFLDTHHDESIREYPPFGHVIECTPGKNAKNGMPCLNYRIDLDPEEKMFIRKAKRGDIPGVSIQVMVDEVTQKEDKFGGFLEANIREYLELSAVLIPGDGDSSMKLAERFNKLQSFRREGVITPDGIMPGKKVKALDDQECMEEKDITSDTSKDVPDEPLMEGADDEESNCSPPKSPKVPNPNHPDEFRFVGNRQTEVAYRGCLCPSCGKQMLKDSYKNGLQLRCFRCDYRISSPLKEV